MGYRLEITEAAFDALDGIRDRRTLSAIARRIEGLTEEPFSLGKALRGKLTGLLSVRAAGQRYRIVYRVDGERESVTIVLIGIRRGDSRDDVYSLAERLVRRGLV